MKKKFVVFSTLTALTVAVAPLLLKSNSNKSADAYSTSSLPTTIDLNDTSAANIRSYYSSLNSLATNQRQGTNLLKNLKTILKSGQKYYSYDSGNAIWQIYEIADRDWSKSPANSTTYGTYNSGTNKITGYTYGTSSSSSKNNPYIHALYINRNVTNQTTAWNDHQQTQWGINREHVWPKAEGFEADGAGGARGDPMHLMAGNGYANNIHSNYYYGYVNTSSSYTNCGSKYSNISGNLLGKSKTLGGSTNVFEPQDCDKGDIARAIFYMVARYNYLSGSDSDGINSNNPNLALTQSLSDWASSGYSSTTSKTGKMGVMTDLLAWHHADPVDEYEIHRNNLLYTNYTNNRNPFIDFPEWADFIWGSVNYSGSTYVSHSTTPTGYATPSSDTINGYNSGGGETIAVTGVSLSPNSTSVEAGKDVALSATVAPSNASNQGVSWSTSDASVATVSGGIVTGVAEGSATITVTTSDGGFTATCAVTVTASSGGGSSEGTDDGSVTAASGALSGWTTSGTDSYADGSVKFDSGGDSVYKTDIFSGDVSTGMTSLTVTINGKINGTPTATNSYKVEALNSSGNVLASDVQTGASIVTTSYGDTVFTIDSGLTGCTGIKITYVTKGGGNWGIKSISWSAAYSTGEEEEATVSSIAVKTAPTTLTYTAGDSFSAVGLVITATYSDSTTADISYSGNEDAFEFNPSDDLQTSDVSVTISYGGKTCSQAIIVNASKTLSSITINTENVTKTFYVDDEFEHDNLVVTAHFSDSSSDVVSSSATVSTPDMSTAGEKTITVSYTCGGTTQTASYTITVLEGGSSQAGSFTWDLSIASYNTPTSAALVTWSADCATLTSEQATGKTAANNYLGGDSNTRTSSRFYTGNTMRFTPASGYEITSVVYTATQGSYATALSGSTWTNATAAVSNSTIVTITPTDGTSEFYAVLTGTTGSTSIVVNYSYTPAASLTSITLDISNVQTTFSVGDIFNYTGLVVTAHYSDSSSSVVTPTSVSTPSTASTGSKTVTVTYTESETTKTATYTITVNANPSISWTAPTIDVYSGSTLSGTDVNGWAVTYNDGTGNTTVLTYSQVIVKLGGTTISIPHTWVAADDGKTLTATYNSLTTSESSAVQVTQTINNVYVETPGEEDTWSHTISAKTWSAYGAQTINSKSWTAAVPNNDGANWGYDSNKGQQFGKAADPCSVLTLSSSDFSGTISTVKVSTSGASSVNATVAVTVGSTAFKSGGSESISISASNTEYTFTGTGSGTITITWTNSSAKALYVKALSVSTQTSSVQQNIANSTDHIAAQRVAVKFAKAFNAAMDTTSSCTTNMSSAWSTCSSAYSTFLSEAAALGSAEEAYAKNLVKYATAQYSDDSGEACIERMMKTYEVCVQKHGQTAFMSDLVTLGRAPSVNPIVNVSNNNNVIVITVITALISIATFGGYFFLRKRKEQ